MATPVPTYTPPAIFTQAATPIATPTTELPLPEIRSRIVTFLNTQTAPAKTLDISKSIYGKGATAKLVNPALYSLEKEGVLIKTAKENGGDPRWTIKRATL